MRKKTGSSSLGVLILLGLIIAGVAYLYKSAMFEREVPSIVLENNGYWNLKKPLQVMISDTSGIKSYRVILKSDKSEVSLKNEQLITPIPSVGIDIQAPRANFTIKDNSVTIIVEAVDASKWNFFNGNAIVKEFTLKIDKKRPQVTTIGNSYKITKGGSALVIFKAVDENLKDIYIQTNSKIFIPQPFYKKGYYISLLAWPVGNEEFKATIIAKDNAGNITKNYVPLYLKDKAYITSDIKLSDSFLKGKIAELAEEFEETQGVTDSIEQFKIINENVRAKNEALIHKITSKVSKEMISDFKISIMYPLRNGQVVANFGDYRKYYYDENKVSESYHMGLDLASNGLADIIPQNGGTVVFADFNGLYGNMPIIDHGLGLYTLYGHCSSVVVSTGDVIQDKTHIANTGKTGYAMGDHLHFGVLVQGIEVRPAEWMDEEWIKLNITDVIKSAKSIIDKS